MSSAQYVILKKLENTKQCSKTLFLFHFSILHRIYFYTIFVIKKLLYNTKYYTPFYHIYICIYLIINIINPPCRTSTYKITYTILTTSCRQFSNTGTSIKLARYSLQYTFHKVHIKSRNIAHIVASSPYRVKLVWQFFPEQYVFPKLLF